MATRRLRVAVIERYGSSCYLCQRPITIPSSRVDHPLALTIDHVVPASVGGRHTIENLRPAHRQSNGEKGDRMPTWWELRASGMVAA